MLKLFVDICVGVMLCTAQTESVKTNDVYLTSQNYNECRITTYVTEDGYTEIKPYSNSLQDNLVIRQCDHFTGE